MSGNIKRRRLLSLIRKYVNGTASDRERIFVEKYYQYFEQDRVSSPEQVSEEEKSAAERRMRVKIHSAIHPEGKPAIAVRRKIFTRAAAAATVLILITGSLLYFYRPPSGPAPQPVVLNDDIDPGTYGAILKMANGRTIVLDTARSGRLVYHAGNVISKTDSAVSIATLHAGEALEYYTLVTPRARQEQLVLADGTKVWLNAASSIRFPNRFKNNQRTVEITGEAYFEVAKDVARPFLVKVNEVEIKVLGTQFNVTAYRDEGPVKTTLLEGAVKVSRGNQTLLLKPGQEAWAGENDQIHLVREANINEALAWKNNLFWFDNDDIRSVMSRLARWYNVDIVINGKIPDLFTGSIPRDLPFSKVFEVLQKTGSIHYKLENHQVIVSP